MTTVTLMGCTPLMASYRADAGGTDVGTDVGAIDAGTTDAGAADVGAMDADTADVGGEVGIDVGEETAVDIGAMDVGEDVPPFRCATNGDCADSGTGAVCDTATGRCVECVATADTCPAGRYCVAETQRCSTGCRDDEGCAVAADGGAAAAGHCVVATHACVACVTDAHCPPGNLCMGNTCVTGCSASQPCAGGQTCCGGGCVDTGGNVAHCGGCGMACAGANATVACVGGACAIAVCSAGFGDCDGSAANGCETDTRSSTAHCGACGMACPVRANAASACSAGACNYNCVCIAPSYLDKKFRYAANRS